MTFGAQTRSAGIVLLLLVLVPACDGGPDDGAMTAETADLTGTYSMLPVEDSDDPFVGAGTIRYEMDGVAIQHSYDRITGVGSCRWTFTPVDPLGAPFSQLGTATLTGSYDDGLMELNVEGDHCPEGAFAGTWTTPDTLTFDLGSYFDGAEPLVLVLQEAGP